MWHCVGLEEAIGEWATSTEVEVRRLAGSWTEVEVWSHVAELVFEDRSGETAIAQGVTQLQ